MPSRPKPPKSNAAASLPCLPITPASTPIKIEGQTQVGVRAEGDVIVERNADVLNADWAQYDQATDTVTAGDRFTLYQNGSTVSGDQLVYNLKDQTGSGTAVHLNTEQGGRRLQSVSEKAELKGKGLYKLINTKFNTCSPRRCQLVYPSAKH